MDLKQNKNILIAWILWWHGNKGSIFQRLEIWTIQGHFCLKQLTLTTTARGGGGGFWEPHSANNSWFYFGIGNMDSNCLTFRILLLSKFWWEKFRKGGIMQALYATLAWVCCFYVFTSFYIISLRGGVEFFFDAWCMMYDAWCMMYDVWCMMHDTWPIMYDGTPFIEVDQANKLGRLDKDWSDNTDKHTEILTLWRPLTTGHRPWKAPKHFTPPMK